MFANILLNNVLDNSKKFLIQTEESYKTREIFVIRIYNFYFLFRLLDEDNFFPGFGRASHLWSWSNVLLLFWHKSAGTQTYYRVYWSGQAEVLANLQGKHQNREFNLRIYAISSIQVGVCVWPVLQTVNFLWVPEGYRVVYVSICSLMWTSFLAYMKSLESKRRLKLLESPEEAEKSHKHRIEKEKKSQSWWSSALRWFNKILI